MIQSQYRVKYVDFNLPPRTEAGRFNPWDQYCHIKNFKAVNDNDAEKKARKLVEGSNGPFAILWHGDRMVKNLKS